MFISKRQLRIIQLYVLIRCYDNFVRNVYFIETVKNKIADD